MESPGPRCTVLIVEDDDMIRLLLCEVLEEESIATRCARSGREGLAAARELPRPCVILLDLALPEMDGVELLEELRADEALRSLPVIVLTASPIPAPETLHADAYLRKPPALDELLAAVQRYCR